MHENDISMHDSLADIGSHPTDLTVECRLQTWVIYSCAKLFSPWGDPCRHLTVAYLERCQCPVRERQLNSIQNVSCMKKIVALKFHAWKLHAWKFHLNVWKIHSSIFINEKNIFLHGSWADIGSDPTDLTVECRLQTCVIYGCAKVASPCGDPRTRRLIATYTQRVGTMSMSGYLELKEVRWCRCERQKIFTVFLENDRFFKKNSAAFGKAVEILLYDVFLKNSETFFLPFTPAPS